MFEPWFDISWFVCELEKGKLEYSDSNFSAGRNDINLCPYTTIGRKVFANRRLDLDYVPMYWTCTPYPKNHGQTD